MVFLMFRPDVVAPADVDGGDAAEDFLPIEDHNMELDQEPEEHVDRHQVSVQPFFSCVKSSVFISC